MANREVFIFRHDAPVASNREPPDLAIVGISQSDVSAAAASSPSVLGNRARDGGNWASTRNRTSSAYEDGMIEILRGILEARADIFPLQVRVVGEDLILCRPGGEHVENVLHADAHVANTRPAPAFSGLDCDSRPRGCRCHADLIRPVGVTGTSRVRKSETGVIERNSLPSPTSGNANTSTTYSGILRGSGGLTKAGNGTFTLAGPNTYSGRTTISGGTLALSGSGSIGTGGLDLGTSGIFDLAALAAGTSTLPATGNLTGAGTLSGNGKTLAVLGSFLPGNSPGTVTLGTGFTLDLTNSGSSVFEITNPLYTPGSYDRVNGTGSVAFGGILSLFFSGGEYAAGKNVLPIFANGGGFSGNFSSVVWTGLAEGQSAIFNASTGYVSIRAVPEPSTLALMAIGTGLAGLARRRRKSGTGASFAQSLRSPTSPLL